MATWQRKVGTVDCTGTEGVPLELKILGALRMPRKGCSFDAIAESSGMSISTMRALFHVFRERFVSNVRDSWIFYPIYTFDPTTRHCV
jgi:hypothetical protein